MALSPKYVDRPAKEETINDPTNPKHYWRYRIHVDLEDLLEDESLIADLQALLLGAPFNQYKAHFSCSGWCKGFG
jgi:4-alpha-glucanotransferase